MTPVIGINLSVDTSYASSRTLNYNLASAGKLCGDNADPASASNVNTSR